jgi:hypothetical protein
MSDAEILMTTVKDLISNGDMYQLRTRGANGKPAGEPILLVNLTGGLILKNLGVESAPGTVGYDRVVDKAALERLLGGRGELSEALQGIECQQENAAQWSDRTGMESVVSSESERLR